LLENISKTYGDLPLAKYGVCRTAAGKPEKYHTTFVKNFLSQIQRVVLLLSCTYWVGRSKVESVDSSWFVVPSIQIQIKIDSSVRNTNNWKMSLHVAINFVT